MDFGYEILLWGKEKESRPGVMSDKLYTQRVISIYLSQPRLHFNKGVEDEKISVSIADP